MGGPDAIAAMAAALLADGDLAALLGGPKVFEHPPARSREPYIRIGPATSRDWSTATEPGEEVEIEMHLHTRGARMREAGAILDRVRAVLRFENVSLPAATLVNLERLGTRTRRSAADDRLDLVQRYRLVMEWKD